PPRRVRRAGQRRADFGTRLLAYLIDGAIVTAVAVVVFIPAVIIFVFTRLDDFEPAYGSDIAEPDVFGDLIWPLLLLELCLLLLLIVACYVDYAEMMYR